MVRCVSAFLISVAFACSAGASTLDQVKAKGFIQCGVSQGVIGFSAPDDKGNWTGFDVDFCRALAAAIFNDANKVKYSPLSTKDRFTALQSGEVDLLSRNTTWTLSRDTSLGLNFAGINYYDGQGFMVKKTMKVNSALELSGATALHADRHHHRAQPRRLFPRQQDEVRGGRVRHRRRDGEGLRQRPLRRVHHRRVAALCPAPEACQADDHTILPDVISKEPLGPLVRHGDDQWFDIVKWVLFAMINAEELGVTSKNVDEMAKSANPEIKRLLGTEGKSGEALGLDNDWVVRIVKRVGNYGEVYDRNVGEGSPLKIERGLNKLWNKGGLQYAPPIR